MIPVTTYAKSPPTPETGSGETPVGDPHLERHTDHGDGKSDHAPPFDELEMEPYASLVAPNDMITGEGTLVGETATPQGAKA